MYIHRAKGTPLSPAATRPRSVHDTRILRSEWKDQELGASHYKSLFGTFDSNTHDDGDRAEVILTGLDVLAKRRVYPRFDFLVDRVELLWNGHHRRDNRYGGIFFSRYRALLHCRDALIGYGGSGPGLTERQFRVLGCGHLFDEVNDAVLHQDYHVVVSREPTAVIDGVLTALPYIQPLPEWRWWRLS